MKLILLTIFAILALEASAAEQKYTVKKPYEKLEQIVKQECKGKTDNIKSIASRNNIKVSAVLKKGNSIYIECAKPAAQAPQAKSAAPAPKSNAAAPAAPAQAAQPAQGETITYKEYNGEFFDGPLSDAKSDSAKNANECKSACTSNENCRALAFTDGKCNLYGSDFYLSTGQGKPVVWVKLYNGDSRLGPRNIN